MSVSLGLEKGMVRLEDFSTSWAAYYQLEEGLVNGLFTDSIIAIAHIGSTAIQGLKAKPIIDILLVLKDEYPLEEAAILLASLGYQKGEFQQEEGVFFIKGENEVHTHYLHLRRQQHAWKKYIVFRDYLMSNPTKALEYESLKANLGSTHATNRELYRRGKEAFIIDILAEAYKGKK
jgi:GrpB-like predicted nucleotidyltransferase (UPF0157 family)